MLRTSAFLIVYTFLYMAHIGLTGTVKAQATGNSSQPRRELIRKQEPRSQDTIPLQFSGFFEGTEPFWRLEVKNNTFVLHCMNDVETGVIVLSEKQTHSETYAFRSTNFFGIIRKPWAGCCELDITEEENPTHEIYFSYKGRTYMGCGWLRR